MPALVAMIAYRPKPGQKEELLATLRHHTPALRELGLITDHPVVHLKAKDGTILEIFEWKSEEHSRSAPTHAAVQELWKRLAELSDFVPVGSLEETAKPFSHFEALALLQK